MASIAVTLPVPAGNGTGAPVVISALGFLKNIVIATPTRFLGSVTIEASPDGVIWNPVASYDTAGQDDQGFAGMSARVRVSGFQYGTATVTMSAEDITATPALAIALPVPAGNGVGASVASNALGELKTIYVATAGLFIGALTIEQSDDAGVSWGPVITLSGPGKYSVELNALLLRVRMEGFLSGSATCGVVGINPDGGGGGPAIPVDLQDAYDNSPAAAITTITLDATRNGIAIVEGATGANPLFQVQSVDGNLFSVNSTSVAAGPQVRLGNDVTDEDYVVEFQHQTTARNLDIRTMDAATDACNLRLLTGAGAAGAGGDLYITTGSGATQGGDLIVTMGDGDIGGTISMFGGDAAGVGAACGGLAFTGGGSLVAGTLGGSVAFTGGSGVASGGSFSFSGGSGAVGGGATFSLANSTGANVGASFSVVTGSNTTLASGGGLFSVTLGSGSLGVPGEARIAASTTTTNAARDILALRHTSTAVAAAGLGVAMRFDLEDDANNVDAAARMQVVWTDAASGSEDASVDFYVVTAGTLSTTVPNVAITGTGTIVRPSLRVTEPTAGAGALVTVDGGAARTGAYVDINMNASGINAHGIDIVNTATEYQNALIRLECTGTNSLGPGVAGSMIDIYKQPVGSAGGEGITIQFNTNTTGMGIEMSHSGSGVGMLITKGGNALAFQVNKTGGTGTAVQFAKSGGGAGVVLEIYQSTVQAGLYVAPLVVGARSAIFQDLINSNTVSSLVLIQANRQGSTGAAFRVEKIPATSATAGSGIEIEMGANSTGDGLNIEMVAGATGRAIDVRSASSGLELFYVLASGQTAAIINDAATATASTALIARHETSAAAGAGFGVAVEWSLQDSSGNNQTAGTITTSWLNASTNTASMAFLVGSGGAASTVLTLGSETTSGATRHWTFTADAHTGTTASTEVSEYLVTAGTRTWATGALTTERYYQWTGPTYAFAGASTVTNAVSFSINAAPAAGANATFTNTIALLSGGDAAIGPTTAAMTYAAHAVPAHTITVTGATGVTSAQGFAAIALGIVTISDATAMTVTNAATLYIAGAPAGAGAGPVTITNTYALFVDGGLARFDGNGANVFELPADATGNVTVATGRVPIRVGGATVYLRYYAD